MNETRSQPRSYKDIGLVNTKEMFRKAMDERYAVPAYNFGHVSVGLGGEYYSSSDNTNSGVKFEMNTKKFTISGIGEVQFDGDYNFRDQEGQLTVYFTPK